MGRKYHKGGYKKGKFLSTSGKKYGKGYTKSQIADLSKTAKITYNYALWKSDPRKYDFKGIDTRDASKFKYKARSKKKLGKKLGRQNKSYRRYWNSRKRFKKR